MGGVLERDNEPPAQQDTNTETHIVAITNVLLYPPTFPVGMEGMKKIILFLCDSKDCVLRHDKDRYLQGDILVCKKV